LGNVSRELDSMDHSLLSWPEAHADSGLCCGGGFLDDRVLGLEGSIIHGFE
jgi:hypothetical protein